MDENNVAQSDPKAQANAHDSAMFPLFVNLCGKRVTIIGGGDSAFRKAKVLLKFGAKIKIIAPTISPELEAMLNTGNILWLDAEFKKDLVYESCDLLIASTNSRQVNHEVYLAAREFRILVCVSDSREESSFLFPTIVQNDVMTTGIVVNHDDISTARRILSKIKERFSGIR